LFVCGDVVGGGGGGGGGELSFVLFMLYQKSGLDLRLFSFLHLFLWSSRLLSALPPPPKKQSVQLLPERTHLKSITYYTPGAYLS
jgi:hypothetical protein